MLEKPFIFGRFNSLLTQILAKCVTICNTYKLEKDVFMIEFSDVTKAYNQGTQRRMVAQLRQDYPDSACHGGFFRFRGDFRG